MSVNFHFNDSGLKTYRQLINAKEQGGPKWFKPTVSSFNSSYFIDTVALDMPLFVFNNLPLIYSAINNQGAPSADITLSVGCNPSLTADVFKVFKTYVIAL